MLATGRSLPVSPRALSALPSIRERMSVVTALNAENNIFFKWREYYSIKLLIRLAGLSGVWSDNTNDLTMCSVPCLYFRKCAEAMCLSYAPGLRMFQEWLSCRDFPFRRRHTWSARPVRYAGRFRPPLSHILYIHPGTPDRLRFSTGARCHRQPSFPWRTCPSAWTYAFLSPSRRMTAVRTGVMQLIDSVSYQLLYFHMAKIQ